MTDRTVNKIQGARSRLTGEIAGVMETFFHERINSDHARNVVYREAEDAFKNQCDDASGVHGLWQGEFWGKWIISAAQVCDYSDNEELRGFIHRAARQLIAYQNADGYLGTYRNSLMVFPADREKTLPVLGWRCNWNWNIWCRKYTLWGLLEAWRISGDRDLLQAAARLADHLIGQLREHHIRLGDTGTFAGIPSGSILKPMLLLHRATGKASYLEFARDIVADWQREDGLKPNLIANSQSGIPVHEWYPNPPEWAKVYEMLSCFEGILDFYELTGDATLLEAAQKFHALLKKHEYNLLFSVGYNDIFNHAAAQLNTISEPCDVIHWMRFCHELFALTGNKTYLDDFELAFYNPFLAAVYRDGCWGARGVRSHGHHLTALEQAKFVHNHCCVNNMPRGFMNLAQAVAATDRDTLFVNFYAESHSEISLARGRVELTVSGDYLISGEVKLLFTASLPEPVKLKLRIPGWAAASTLEHGETAIPGNGDWFEVMLSPGTTAMTLRFERELQIRRHAPSSSPSSWYMQRWKSEDQAMEELFLTTPAHTMVYGPLLLARSRFNGNSEAEMFGPALPDGFSCRLRRIEAKNTRYAFAAEIRAGHECFRTTVCDYASAGNDKLLDEPKFFSVFF